MYEFMGSADAIHPSIHHQPASHSLFVCNFRIDYYFDLDEGRMMVECRACSILFPFTSSGAVSLLRILRILNERTNGCRSSLALCSRSPVHRPFTPAITRQLLLFTYIHSKRPPTEPLRLNIPHSTTGPSHDKTILHIHFLSKPAILYS